MTTFQDAAVLGRRLMPRGWTAGLRWLSTIVPTLRQYRVTLSNGERLYVNLGERMCLLYFFEGGLPHEAGIERLMREHVAEGSVAIDVGANVGYYTRMLSRLTGSRGKTYAFEPLPKALGLLKLNTRDLANAVVIEKAASDQAGSGTFYSRFRGDTSSLEAANDGGRGVPIGITLTTVDEELPGVRGVSLMKIDVEGYELEVLRGAERTLRANRPIVLFEYLQRIADRRGFGLQSFVDLLAPMGYELRWVSRSGELTPLDARPKGATYVAAVPSGA
jgi:FkbM family methyltransferase